MRFRLAMKLRQPDQALAAIAHLDVLMSHTGGETVSIATLRIDPVWDPLRKDSRFQALLTKYPGDEKTATP